MGSCFGRCISKEPHAVSSSSTTTSCFWQSATDEQDATELISNTSDKCKSNNNFIYRIIKFKRKQKRPQFIDKFWEHKNLTYTQLNTKPGNDNISDIQLQNLDVQNLLNSNTLAKESALNYAPNCSQAARAPSSRDSSSLDLEWEHEYAQMRFYASPLHASHAHNNNNTINATDNSCSLKDSWQFLGSDDVESQTSMQSLTPAAAAVVPLFANATTTAAARRLMRYPQQQSSSRQNFNRARSGSIPRTSSHNSWSHISTPESLEWDVDEEQQRQLRVEDDGLDHETLQLLHQIELLKNQVLNETGDGLFEENGIEFNAGATPAKCNDVISDYTDIS